MLEFECRVSTQVPAAHPCLAGHFPGNPVVPAVLLLDLVQDVLRAWRGPQWRLRRLLAAKFLLPLRPDQSFEIVLRLADTRLDWRCERDAHLLAEGRGEIGSGELVT